MGASADPTKRGYKAMVGLIKDGYNRGDLPDQPEGRHDPRRPHLRLARRRARPDRSGPDLYPRPRRCRGCSSNAARRGEGAVILASGFRETGPEGLKLEQQVLDAARAGGVRIIGPNTSGMFNLHKKVNLLALANVKAGRHWLHFAIGQHVAVACARSGAQRPGRLSTYVGPGNQTDIGFNDYLRYLARTPTPRSRRSTWRAFATANASCRRRARSPRSSPWWCKVRLYRTGCQGRQLPHRRTGGSYAMTVDLLRQVG